MDDEFVDHFNNIKIILVNTSHPGNIGASARAMKNMGLNNLVLVNPRDFPSGVAVGRAASALDILESAKIFDTLEAAISDCELVIGASARQRKIPWPMLSPDKSAVKILEECRRNKIALVFGREESGLNNEELQMCNFHMQIPANENYSSLNLAMAVMVICYELRKNLLANLDIKGFNEQSLWDQEKATGEQLEHFYHHLERVLIAIKFHDPENPRQLMQRMRRLFSRIRIDVMEMSILRGILTNIESSIGSNQKSQ